MRLLHRAQENLEPIRKNAEFIFDDPPGSGKTVVQDALMSDHRAKASSPMRVEGEMMRGWEGTRLYNPWPHSLCTPRTR